MATQMEGTVHQVRRRARPGWRCLAAGVAVAIGVGCQQLTLGEPPPAAAATRAEAPAAKVEEPAAKVDAPAPPAAKVVVPAAKAAPAKQPVPNLHRASSAVRAERHMIATANPLAAKAGRDILRAGGSAMDAAIAAQMVLNLVEPQSSGIGGGGFLLHFAAGSGEIAAYDGRETAPAAANPYMFMDGTGKPMAFLDAVVGGRSVGVPGLLRMLEMGHGEHGRLPWARLFEPAIRLAETGFAVTRRLRAMIVRTPRLDVFAAARAYFFDADGKPPSVGTVVTNRRLASTLRAIAEGGADAFYSGAIARDVAWTVANAGRNPARLTVADLAAYKAVKRQPVCLPYRTWLVCGMGPPSSGGITALQILGLLERFDAPAPESAEAVHLILEASRIAFADRNTYIADPDFIPVPTAGLLDPQYLDLRAAEISPGQSLGKAQPGMPGMGALLAPGRGQEGVSTTHLSVVDAEGNAVALTSSIESAFGSRLMVRGFLLNNQLTDFSFEPNRDAAPVANRVAPGKRPRSSMAPTLVFDSGGRLVMALGSPGGSRIIGYVAKTLVAALDWKLNLQEAVDLPHFVNRNGPTELEAGTAIEDLAPALRRLGHRVRPRRLTSGLHAIMVKPHGLEGGADSRREGIALGD